VFYVYAIQNMADCSEIYIGYTADLRRRLIEHNSPQNTGYTRNKKWRVIYYEAFLSEKDARRRERRLKQDGRARYQLMKRLSNSLEVNQNGCGRSSEPKPR